jgi:phosphonate transport system permease protein
MISAYPTPPNDRPVPIPPPKPAASDRIVPVIYVTLTIVALVWSLSGMDISWGRIATRSQQAAVYFRQMFLETDWSYLPKTLKGLQESFQIAALGTFLAAILAIPFGALAARNLSRLPVLPAFGKFFLNFIRAFPELILAIAFIKAIGPGAFAGVLAIGLHSIGMMGKLYAERIESVDKNAIEALSAAGASPLEIFRHAILPEVLPDFLSFALFRLDINIRAATVLGIVGAGGVGTLLELQRRGNNWRTIGTIFICIVITVIIVDFISAKLRAKLT